MPRGATSDQPRTRRSHPRDFKANRSLATRKRRKALIASLADVGVLRVDQIELPGGGGTLRITRPGDFDPLLEAAVSDPEQNLPYWAEIWPSGIALAASIARDSDALCGKRVLELGCGLGVTAIAALRAGADLLVTDYAPEALSLCALNTLDQTGREPTQLRLNWRNPGAELVEVAGEGFPVVLAADVLYEERDVTPLINLVQRIVRPGGELWLAEPRRDAASRFLEAIRRRGWSGPREEWAGPWPDADDVRKAVKVNVHRLRRPRD